MKDAPHVLVVDGLMKEFAGFRAVKGVSFVVGRGELVALIGPNGAGKTTTFNLINGQLAADRGRVLLHGGDVTGKSPASLWRLGVARTFQVTATFVSMSVMENVLVGIASRESAIADRLSVEKRFEREAISLLEEVGIGALADRQCGLLSYGDLKRVELALALINAPKLLLMDEPTAGMAPAERRQLMRLVEGLARNRGTAVLFTEHDMDVVFGHADRVLVMHRGQLIAAGSPADVRANAEVRDVYLGHGLAATH